MTKAFHESSYLSQVRQLRQLAEVAVLQFPIGARALHFINHGENATFRIEATSGRRYLLRIHRESYHTRAAIEEELAWLSLLSANGMRVPKPLTSRSGQWVESIHHARLNLTRHCCLFEWIDGRFIGKSVHPHHLYQIGQTIATLQTLTPRSRVKHRRYWHADGLLGLEPKFGSLARVKDATPKELAIIARARQSTLKRLRQFEMKHPTRQGLIHADLHFGNVLATDDGLGVIDFDDSGFGFHAYDLVIPLMSTKGLLGEKHQHRLPEFKEALLTGYIEKKTWDKDDDLIFHSLWTARRLTMLGWLNSRSDNPKLRKHLRSAIERVLSHLKQPEDLR